MNCDQAFDAMTDPARPHGRKLGDHLRACPRCRQMYETLEPALGLFAAVEGDGGETLPSVPTRIAPAPARLAQQIAGRMPPVGSDSADDVPRRRLWGAVFAAAVAGFLLSVGLSSISSPHQSSAPALTSECTWLNRGPVLDGRPASEVVVACVTCHLSSSPHRDQQHTSFREFSRDLESIVEAWHTTPTPFTTTIAMVILFPPAETNSGDALHV